MRWRSTLVVAVSLAAAALASDARTGQEVPRQERTSGRPPERTWTLGRDVDHNFSGPYGYRRFKTTVTVNYKERYDRTEAGHFDWIAGPRRVNWSTSLEEGSYNYVDVHPVHGRRRADAITHCAGAANVVLNPGPSVLSANERMHFRLACMKTVTIRRGSGPGGTYDSWEDGLKDLPYPIHESYLTGCRYREVRRGSSEVETITASLSPSVAATLEFVSDQDRTFVPEPGRVVRVTGKSPSPVLWAFDLDSVSHLRGYATNADVDRAFFEVYDLPFLWNLYGTYDPDLMFDPRKYERPTREWKAVMPGRNSNKWGRLESKVPMNGATVEVTAMDYGAHGELRAYVKPSCGDWVEVEHPLRLPVDDNGNSIADAARVYDQIGHPSFDTDLEPHGDGPGDGLSVFDEYRGFVLPTDTSCAVTKIRHERTSPTRKDLFVNVTDPLLTYPVVSFHRPSGLAVHRICPRQYVNDEVRVVNFTMHIDEDWGVPGGLSREEPQHGLRLVNEPLPRGILGTAGDVGTPRDIIKVVVDVAQILAAYRGEPDMGEMLRGITWHELAHAVNVEHHGVGNVAGPFVILEQAGCAAGLTQGTVAGRPACKGTGLAVREAENSGTHTCPTKYVDWKWYVRDPQGLTPRGEVTFDPLKGWPWMRVRRLPAFEGRIGKYRQDLDRMGLGQLCRERTGTGVNALPHDQNHAGSSRYICADQLRVADSR